MAFLEKFESFNRRISGCFEWVGVCGLLLMMVITCADVFGAKLFRQPVYGAFVALFPTRLRAIIDTVISFFGLIFFALIVWRLAAYGYSLQTGGEVSATIRIPLYPFAYGVAVASIPVALIFLVRMLKTIVRIVEK